MSVPCKFERSLLSHEEYETIKLTHHPAIYDIEAGELEANGSALLRGPSGSSMRRFDRRRALAFAAPRVSRNRCGIVPAYRRARLTSSTRRPRFREND